MGDVLPAWWVSWVSPDVDERFELHTPWWRQMDTPAGSPVFVAAVRAVDEEGVADKILDAYPEDYRPAVLLERFCIPLPRDTPFDNDYVQAEWMAWEADGTTCACDDPDCEGRP